MVQRAGLGPAPTERTEDGMKIQAGDRKGRPYGAERQQAQTGGRIISAPTEERQPLHRGGGGGKPPPYAAGRRRASSARPSLPVPGGRGGEAELRRKFFAKLSFKKAGVSG